MSRFGQLVVGATLLFVAAGLVEPGYLHDGMCYVAGLCAGYAVGRYARQP